MRETVATLQDDWLLRYFELLSFLVDMFERLDLPIELDGMVWRYDGPAAANRRHRHAELELNLVTRGHGTYLLEDRRYEIRRGDLLWLFPGQEHVLIEQTAGFSMWIAVFRRRALQRTVSDPSLRPLRERIHKGETCRRLGPEEFRRCDVLLREIAAYADNASLTNSGLAYALLLAWHIFASARHIPVRKLHPGVERVARAIRDGADGLQLDELGRIAELSPSRLSRLFRQQTGSSIVQFRNRQRIERVRRILQSQETATLLDAALEAGFGSYPQFHRVFRQLCGCSPADYVRGLESRRPSAS
jgi:AraC-like DNA-binding protein